MHIFASSHSDSTEGLEKNQQQHLNNCAPLLVFLVLAFLNGASQSQSTTPVTAPIKTPPKVWVDKETRHRILRLTDEPGSKSLYFDKQAFTPDGLDMIYTSPLGIHDLNLTTMQSTLLVGGGTGVPIIAPKTRRVFYENFADGRYYVIDIDTKLITQLPLLPARGHLTTVNADETLLAGTFLEGASPELARYRFEKRAEANGAVDDELNATLAVHAAAAASLQSLGESLSALNGSGQTPRPDVALSKLNDASSKQASVSDLTADMKRKQAEATARINAAETEAVQERFKARAPEDLFTLNPKTGEVKVLLKGRDWLNHVEFSPTDPGLLLYAHEGPALEVDRVWTIRADGSRNTLMQKRSAAASIATHEFWSRDGSKVWFNLQESKGEAFAVTGVDVATGEKTTYRLLKQEASIHYNISPDGKVFCGDGNLMTHGEIGVNGHRTLDRAWIELLRPYPDGVFHSTRLAHISANDYLRTEPNARFSPDGKQVIFTSNMYGHNYIFAVDVAKAPEGSDSGALPGTRSGNL